MPIAPSRDYRGEFVGARLVPIKPLDLNRNLPEFHRFTLEQEEIAQVGHEMESVEKFRKYAADCRQLAQRANAQDRVILMIIAEAWLSCAEEAERKEKPKSPAHDGSDSP